MRKLSHSYNFLDTFLIPNSGMDKDGSEILTIFLILVAVKHVFLPPHSVPCRVVGEEINIPLLTLVKPRKGKLNNTF